MEKIAVLFCLVTALHAFPLGGNLNGIADYSFDIVFVNQVKASRQFGLKDTPWVTTGMTYDSNGWPTKDFGVILIGTGSPQTETAGIWYLSWTGNATVSPVATSASIINQTYDATTNTGVAYVNMPATEGSLMLGFATNNVGITNLKAIRPGYDINSPPTFTKSMLTPLQGLDTFRFMDWGATNGNPITKWSQRTSPTTAQSLNGAAWEYAIEISNTVKSNMWVNIPHMADDDYVFQFATLLKANLDPSLHVYIEYSNEVWNSGFPQFGWNLNEAQQMVNNGTWGPILNYDNSNNIYDWAFRRVALRAKMISDTFRQVWGDCAINDRVRVVLASQIANPYILETGLDMINAVYGPPNKYFYATAGAPYFNLGDANNNNSLTVDDVVNALNASSISCPQIYNYNENIAYSTFYKLKYLAYEGGSDTFGPNSIQAKKNASLDSRMTPIVEKYLQDWYAYGGDLFNWFTYTASNYDTQYGTWGVTNDPTNLNAPKLKGIKNVVSSSLPKITAGHILPNNVKGGDKINPDSSGFWRYMSFGDKAKYFLNDQHTFGAVYNVYFNYSAYYDSGVTVELNNELVFYNLSLPANQYNVNISEAVNVTILSGISTMQLVSTATVHSAFQINSIIFEFVAELTSAPVVVNNCTVTTTSTGTGAATANGSTTGSEEVGAGAAVKVSFLLMAMVFVSLF